MITLTLTFDTTEQAHHVLEAYGEARCFGQPGATPQVESNLPPASAPISEHKQAIAGLPAGNAPAPVAGASMTGATFSNPSDNLDTRGVPHHPDYHGENKTDQGAWKRKRNHNKAAADAYEARYLTATPQQPAAPATLPPAPPPPAPQQPAAPMMPAPAAAEIYSAPAVRYLPSVQEYDGKWIDLCKAGKVTGNHQKMIETKFGAHPCSPQVRDVEENRRQIWVAFLAWEAGDTGAAV
jgi:hypothetical protein